MVDSDLTAQAYILPMLIFRFPPYATVLLSQPDSPEVDAVGELYRRATQVGLTVQRGGGLGSPVWIVECSEGDTMLFKLAAADLFSAYPPTSGLEER